MRVTLVLPDDLYDKYRSQAKDQTPEGVRAEIKDRLTRFQEAHNMERAIILVGPDRQEMERLLEIPVKDGPDLVRRVKNLSQMRIGTLERPISEDEAQRIRQSADFYGETPQDHFRRVMDDIFNQFFTGI